MMNTIETSWSRHQKVLSRIRSEVFINEQRVPEELEVDEFDADASHFLVIDRDQYIATGRLLDDGHIGRLAVLKAYRNRGIGSGLLSDILAKAMQKGLNQVFLHAQVNAVMFYQRHGFQAVGNVFMDAGIPHNKMIKQLTHE